jgi:hypothetical protein
LKHAIIKKLEDFFFRRGVYRYAHVTRPLGITEKGYIYEWAFGTDSFPWYNSENGEWVSVHLDDWNEFAAAFYKAGIDLQSDCTTPDDGRISQNIIHQFPYFAESSFPGLNRLWKRIDFGDRSIKINYDKLLRYLSEHKDEIRDILKIGRYDLMVLACKYLQEGDDMDPVERGKMDVLALDYRFSTLNHLNTRGVGSTGDVKII